MSRTTKLNPFSSPSNRTLSFLTMFAPTRLIMRVIPRTSLSQSIPTMASRRLLPSQPTITTTRGMATKKAGGSSNNGRDSIGRRLGIKVWPNQQATAGNILVRRKSNARATSLSSKNSLTLCWELLRFKQSGAKNFAPEQMLAWGAIILSLPRWMGSLP